MKVRKYEMMLRESNTYDWEKGSYKRCLRGCNDVYNFIKADETFCLAKRPEEHFLVFAVNVKGETIGFMESSIGDISSTNVNVQQIATFLLLTNAAGCIVAHNHPSSDVKPSDDDILATKRLYEALKLLNIKLVDHLIVGPGDDYTSFQVEGLMPY